MGSSPTLTTGRVVQSGEQKTINASSSYCEGGAKVAHLAHYQKTTFESFARNHIAGSSKGRTLDSLPSNLGSTPSRAPKVVHAYVNCEPRERMDCLFFS